MDHSGNNNLFGNNFGNGDASANFDNYMTDVFILKSI